VNVAGGWHHLTSRGQNRQRIFEDARDYRDFLSRLEEMSGRYGLEVHGYVLMPNHYHLIARSPKANTSEAMQWLNNGYAMWRNRRHGRTGHVFGGRYKGIVVEEGQWLLELSLYVHFNPVAVRGLGWGKRQKAAERMGLQTPAPDLIAARLETLRGYRWSSYHAYAGYTAAPSWLQVEAIMARVADERPGYRKLAEDRLRQGTTEPVWTRLRWGAVLGGEAFADAMRKGMRIARETTGRRSLRAEASWPDVVLAVERVKGESWDGFRDRYGDWGRDLALWVARRYGGLTLRELGDAAGGMDYSAVSEAVRHFQRHRLPRAEIRAALREALRYLNLET
jgi:REP element-mobilizing transposase RayT